MIITLLLHQQLNGKREKLIKKYISKPKEFLIILLYSGNTITITITINLADMIVVEKKKSGARLEIETRTKETEQKGDKLNVKKKML